MLLATAPGALGAEPVRAFHELHDRSLIAQGETITITRSDASKHSGTLLELSATGLALGDARGRTELEASDIERITVRRRDSVKNGALIGALIGVPLGVVNAGLADEGNKAALFIVGTGIWAVIGAGIDALIPTHQTVLAAKQADSRRASGARLSLGPASGEHGAAFVVSLRF